MTDLAIKDTGLLSRNFWMRIATGAAMITIIVVSVVFNLLYFFFLVLLVNLLGLNEFYNLFKKYTPRKSAGIFLSLIFFITSGLVVSGISAPFLLLYIIPAAFTIFLIVLYDRSEQPFMELAITFLGIIYITVPSILLLMLAYIFPTVHGFHPGIILTLFYLIWSYDSGAYLVGKLVGKTPLFLRISPGKTWEGVLGGTLCALLIAYLNSVVYPGIALIHWISIALIVVVIGTFGDLIKSRMKRSLNVKDSGNILPGHGGMIDRFDSLLSSAPFVLIYILVLKDFER